MPTVTERRVVRLGEKALVITIPKAWSDYYGVKAGDHLRVVANGVLTVHPPKPGEVHSDKAREHG